jgi:hypothetical protein
VVVSRRTRLDVVVARHVVRAIVGAVLLGSLGNMLLIGCVLSWVLNGAPSFNAAVGSLAVALALYATAAATALVGWSWAR